jgi:uncharacterized tellurite resistance protein B-like protein
MLNTIRQFFDNRLNQAGGPSAPDEHRLRLATAALLIEMMRMDDDIKDEEREAVVIALQAKFDLSEAETAELVCLAEEEARTATDYFQFTSLINQHFSAAQKQRVIEHLWEVAYADGGLDRHEEHLMRKIADLLYIPYKTYIGAKLRARERRTGGHGL